MDEPSEPIAYTALQPGTPVKSSDGTVFGKVEWVLAVESEDVFDGIVVKTDNGRRFVDADSIGSIDRSYVETSLTPDQVAGLPTSDDSAPVFDVNDEAMTGKSITDRFRRMFQIGEWKRED